MPSRRAPSGSRAAVVLAVLAVLAASIPATAGTVTGGSDALASGVSADRVNCPRDSTATGQVTPSVNASSRAENATASPVPNESADLGVARGDVAVVPLSVPAGANATVSVGSGDGYAARLAVRDDGDGRVRLLVNTYLAGNRTTVAPDAYRTAGDDVVTAVGGTPTAPMNPGVYPVTARTDGRVVAEQELTVTDPSFESVTAHRAVPRLFDATNASEVRAADDSGLTGPLRPGEYEPEVVSGETLLLRIDAPSLLGVIAAKPGNTTTRRFRSLDREVEPETAETFEIFGPCGGILFPDTVDEGGARVLLDYREGAAYVLLDTDNLEGLDDGGQSVYVEVAPESRLNGMDEQLELTTEFRIDAPRITARPNASETVPLSADERATVTADTNLLPGSRVSVRVASRVDPTFERATTATVEGNGTVTATLDLSNASVPGAFAVTIGGEQFPAEVGDRPEAYWELRQVRTTDPLTELSLERLDLPDDGLLVAYRYDAGAGKFRPFGSATPGDDDLAVEPLSDPQQLLLAVHRDANGNAAFDAGSDPPYRVDGRVVRDWTGVEIDGGEPPDEPPATFDADRVATPTSDAETTDRDAVDAGPTTTTAPNSASADATTASDEVGTALPGFGPAAVLLAFGVLLALAVRRSFRARDR